MDGLAKEGKSTGLRVFVGPLTEGEAKSVKKYMTPAEKRKIRKLIKNGKRRKNQKYVLLMVQMAPMVDVRAEEVKRILEDILGTKVVVMKKYKNTWYFYASWVNKEWGKAYPNKMWFFHGLRDILLEESYTESQQKIQEFKKRVREEINVPNSAVAE